MNLNSKYVNEIESFNDLMDTYIKLTKLYEEKYGSMYPIEELDKLDVYSPKIEESFLQRIEKVRDYITTNLKDNEEQIVPSIFNSYIEHRKNRFNHLYNKIESSTDLDSDYETLRNILYVSLNDILQDFELSKLKKEELM